MYRPNTCTWDDCDETTEALGFCRSHLWRWALRCMSASVRHVHSHDLAA